MVGDITAEIFQSFLFGSIAVVLGGVIFESGRRYVKRGGSNQFKGKIEALPFFLGTLIMGFILRYIEAPISSVVHAVPPVTRVGVIGLVTMALFNYTIPNFNYFDWKSVVVYLVSIVVAIYPFMQF